MNSLPPPLARPRSLRLGVDGQSWRWIIAAVWLLGFLAPVSQAAQDLVSSEVQGYWFGEERLELWIPKDWDSDVVRNGIYGTGLTFFGYETLKSLSNRIKVYEGVVRSLCYQPLALRQNPTTHEKIAGVLESLEVPVEVADKVLTATDLLEHLGPGATKVRQYLPQGSTLTPALKAAFGKARSLLDGKVLGSIGVAVAVEEVAADVSDLVYVTLLYQGMASQGCLDRLAALEQSQVPSHDKEAWKEAFARVRTDLEQALKKETWSLFMKNFQTRIPDLMLDSVSLGVAVKGAFAQNPALGFVGLGLLAVDTYLGLIKQEQVLQTATVAATVHHRLRSQVPVTVAEAEVRIYAQVVFYDALYRALSNWAFFFKDLVRPGRPYGDLRDGYSKTRDEALALFGERNAPTVRLLSPTEGSTLAGPSALTLQVTDDLGLGALGIWVGGNSFTGSLGGKSLSGSATVEFDTAEFPQGRLVAYVVAQDAVGNQTTTNFAFQVKNVLAVTHNGPWFVESGKPFTLSGRAALNERSLPNATVTFRQQGRIVGSTITDADGNYTAAIPAPVAKGWYDFSVEASGRWLTTSVLSELQVLESVEGYDLGLSILPDSSSSTRLGGVATIRYHWLNHGIKPASGTVVVRLLNPAGEPVGETLEVTTGPIQPGETGNTQTIQMIVGAVPGSYTVVANLVTEPGETNWADNRASWGVRVGDRVDVPGFSLESRWVDRFPMDVTYGEYTIRVSALNSSRWEVTIGSVKRAGVTVGGSRKLTDGQFWFLDAQNLVIYFKTYAQAPAPSIELQVGGPPSPLVAAPGELTVGQGQPAEFRLATPGEWLKEARVVADQRDGQVVAPRASFRSAQRELVCTVQTAGLEPRAYDWLVFVHGENRDFCQRLRLTVLGHDASVALDCAASTDDGATVALPCQLAVANGLVETVNVLTTIVGPAGYSLSLPPEEMAVSGVRSHTLVWPVGGLAPGSYSVTTRVQASHDVHPENDAGTCVITLPAPSSLGVSLTAGAPRKSQGETLRLSAVVNAELSPVPDASVVAHVERPDGAIEQFALFWNQTEKVYFGLCFLTEVGNYRVTAQAIRAGSLGGQTDRALDITVTNSPPVTTITSSDPEEDGWTRTPDVELTWTGFDTGTPTENVRFAYRLDGQDWSSFEAATGHRFAQLADGLHAFEVKGHDGELETPAPAQRTFGVDHTPPVIRLVSPDSSYVLTNEGTLLLAGVAEDAASGSGLASVYCSHATSNEGTPANWRFRAHLSPGTNYVVVQALDQAANTATLQLMVVSTSPAPLPDLFHLPLDGDTADRTGRGLDGVASDARPTTGVDLEPEGAYAFDGTTNSFIAVPIEATNNPPANATFAFWMRLDDARFLTEAVRYNTALMGSGYNDRNWGRGWYLWLRREEGVTQLGMYSFNGQADGQRLFKTPVSLGCGLWHHVAFTKEGSRYCFYFDGILIGSADFGIDPLPLEGLRIGGAGPRNQPGDLYRYYPHFPGSIADVRAYSRTLAAEEITVLSGGRLLQLELLQGPAVPGELRVLVHGQAEKRCALESTSDLVHWSRISMAPVGVVIGVPADFSSGARYFRAVQLVSGEDGGTVRLSNAAGPPATEIDGVTRLSGPFVVAQLVVGPSEASLEPFSQPVPLGSGLTAGSFDGGDLRLEHVSPCTDVLARVRLWDQTTGATWEQASRRWQSNLVPLRAGGRCGDANQPPGSLGTLTWLAVP